MKSVNGEDEPTGALRSRPHRLCDQREQRKKGEYPKSPFGGAGDSCSRSPMPTTGVNWFVTTRSNTNRVSSFPLAHVLASGATAGLAL